MKDIPGFLIVDIERTWWRIFQKRVVCTTFDIYVLLYQHTMSNICNGLKQNDGWVTRAQPTEPLVN
jgi:hypothetical protein